MSKGTKIIPVRVSKELRDEIAAAIKSRNLLSREEPWRTSHFIRQAIIDKLNHIKRSRAKKPRIVLDETLASVGD